MSFSENCFTYMLRNIHNIHHAFSLYNNIQPPSKLTHGADLYCFKCKIEPKWEDPICANGGKWTITLARGKADTVWLYTVCFRSYKSNSFNARYMHVRLLIIFYIDFYQLLAMIGEQFDDGDEICGAVVNVRGKQDRISIWTKNATNEAVQVTPAVHDTGYLDQN